MRNYESTRPSSPKHMKIFKVLSLLLPLTLLQSCSSSSEQATAPRTVKVYTVEATDGAQERSYPGKVRAANEAQLSFRVAGQIAQITAQPGTLVRKGQTLAVLDQRDYLTQLRATEAEYQAVKAQADRIIQLYTQQSISTNDYDKAVSGLKQITQKLEAHRNALADTRLVAPYDGYVQTPLRHVGETIGAGMPVMVIYSGGKAEIEVSLPNSEYLRRDEFHSYSCRLDGSTQEDYPLELISIDPIASNNQLHNMRLRFTSLPEAQVPQIGMGVMVSIHTQAESQGKVRLPMSSVWEQDGQSYVWEITHGQETSTIARKQIQIEEILRDGYLTARGINPGKAIVSAGASSLREGQEVKPLKEASSTNIGALL